MIVRGSDGRKRNFLGVDFTVLACGKESMVTKMLYKAGDHVPVHRHPNEQSGYVLTGKYRIRFGVCDQEIGPGDTYSIPRNVEHSLDIVEPGEVIDCFSPPREDYL
jgi:quercetin dioxygenase-like cupin family protein